MNIRPGLPGPPGRFQQAVPPPPNYFRRAVLDNAMRETDMREALSDNLSATDPLWRELLDLPLKCMVCEEPCGYDNGTEAAAKWPIPYNTDRLPTEAELLRTMRADWNDGPP